MCCFEFPNTKLILESKSASLDWNSQDDIFAAANMLKSTCTLIVFNIAYDFIIQAIIVERNLHSYYRLPTSTIKTSNSSEDFYILQCPFKSSLNIPTPKDMPICMIVGRHSENLEKEKELIKAKPRSQLNTQVDYRYLKPPIKVIKVVKIRMGKPYVMYLKPVKNNENFKSPIPIKLLIQNSPKAVNQTTMVYPVPIVHKLQVNNDSLALSTTINEAQKLTQVIKPTSQPDDFIDDPFDEEDTQHGPLKYLGVQDVLKQLKLKQAPPHNPAAVNESNFQKGYRTKGYQNMYHRDELYQDHIFYDDLQQMGNYRIQKKYQEKKPEKNSAKSGHSSVVL
ncbi:hypothetical protein DOY81_004740 [Sarcophaga bullata]|nr:hypothetical protein DOY81_004740 [Sarcophaga bullata]